MAKATNKTLSIQQQRFCENFVSKEFFGNGVESYIDAHEIDITKPNAYNAAKVSAYRQLQHKEILRYINALLDAAGLNDAFVDKQLLFLITQNADLGSKTRAIAEYNKLKQRIIEKVKTDSEIVIKVVRG